VAQVASAGLVVFAAGVLSASGVARTATSPHASIVSVRALPVAVQRGGEAALTTSKLNVVTASSALGFRVKVRNEGSSLTTPVTVTLTIDRRVTMGGPVIHQETLGVIPAHTTKTVTFTHLGDVPFASQTSLTVRLPSGASKVFPVIFSLP
jgi:hypothetical protein